MTQDTTHPELCSPAELADRIRTDAVTELMRTTDASSVQAGHVVDTLTKHHFTIDDLPGSEHGAIAAILADLDARERDILGTFIAGRYREYPRWLYTALVAAEQGDEIHKARAALRDRLTTARTALRDAQAALDRLNRELYDVEYAEGDGLLRHYLNKADRAIDTAIKVNPFPEG